MISFIKCNVYFRSLPHFVCSSRVPFTTFPILGHRVNCQRMWNIVQIDSKMYLRYASKYSCWYDYIFAWWNHQLFSISSRKQSPSTKKFCGCIPADSDAFLEMLNFGLLTDPIFVIFALSNFSTCLGFYVPYFCLADKAKMLGMTTEEASYLLATIGIANTVGRIVLGYISDKSWINRLWVYSGCLFTCGLGKILQLLIDSMKLHKLMSTYSNSYCRFGFLWGFYVVGIVFW